MDVLTPLEVQKYKKEQEIAEVEQKIALIVKEYNKFITYNKHVISIIII